MRCLTPTTIYAFTSTGTTRGTVAGVSIGTTEVTTCPAGTYAVLLQTEVNSDISPFNLTLVEAGSFAGAVVSLWAVGLGIRMIIRAIKEASSPDIVD